MEEPDPYATESKFPCALCHFGPDVWGLYFFQASDAAAEPAGSVEGAEKDVKDKNKETKELPTNVPASRDHRQVHACLVSSPGRPPHPCCPSHGLLLLVPFLPQLNHLVNCVRCWGYSHE